MSTRRRKAEPKLYIDICAGISATTLAAKGTAWKAYAYSEIEDFPCAVLAHHYPKTPNLGDLNNHEHWPLPKRPLHAIIAGTPCQDFSVAGDRAGIHGERGNLTLELLRFVERARPRWLIWENVPGVFSATSHDAPVPVLPRDDMAPDDWEQWAGGVVPGEYDADEHHAFSSFLSALQELGYGIAWRVLDAANFGVPQQRRRVFVVGYLGNWRGAVAALFERDCLRGDPAQGRRPRANTAAAPAASSGSDDDVAAAITAGYNDNRGRQGGKTDGGITPGHLIADVPGRDAARTINAGGQGRQDFDTENLVVAALTTKMNGDHDGKESHLVVSALTQSDGGSDVKHAQAWHLVPVTIHGTCPTKTTASETETAGALRTREPGMAQNSSTTVVVAFEPRQRGDDGRGYSRPPAMMEDQAPTINTVKAPCVSSDRLGVRRLTVVECERLQGMPDNYTLIPWPGRTRDPQDFAETFTYLKGHGFSDEDAWVLADTPDSPRYRAVGNSIAVPVMRWILQRIDLVDSIYTEVCDAAAPLDSTNTKD